MACLAAVCTARDYKLTFGPTKNSATSHMTVCIGNRDVFVPIPPMTSATRKRDLVNSMLLRHGFRTSGNLRGGNSLTLLGVDDHETVSVSTNGTASAEDSVTTARPDMGVIQFGSTFAPMDAAGQPAIFRAGIVTDAGEVTVQVSATELNFVTDGPIICQALFQRLAPRAPQYGAQINYAGDRLEVYFDPAYSIGMTGTIFGTTSQTPGCSSNLELAPMGKTVTLEFGASTNSTPANFVQFGVNDYVVPISIVPMASGHEIREAVQLQVQTPQCVLLDAWVAHECAQVRGLVPQSTVSYAIGSSAALVNRLLSEDAEDATIMYTGHFQAFGQGNAPAIFRAGIVTDVGELSVQVSASELNFQTDGPIICQALFQRLEPRARDYGAQILFAGDRLEVYFDPAYTLTVGGVVYGTTSRSPGCRGELQVGH